VGLVRTPHPEEQSDSLDHYEVFVVDELGALHTVASMFERVRAVRIVRELVREFDADVLDDEMIVATSALLRVGPHGEWFELHGSKVGLREHPITRRIFHRLVRHRLAEPGATLSRGLLFGVGWPGREIESSNIDRLVVDEIWRLRKLGLADYLETRQQGFRLAPDLDIEE
jgi:hypothetical protein